MVRTLSTPLMIVVGLVIAAAALGLSSTSVGAAPSQQDPYPEVCPCVVVVSVAEAAPSAGDCIPVTCKASYTDGAPVPDLECTMSVLSQPGSDASVTPATSVTDKNGEATAQLCVGSAAGPVVVLAKTTCCGSEGQIEVTAQTPVPTALPGVTPGPTPMIPPATGAGTGGGDSWLAPLIAIWSAVALAAGAVLIWRLGNRRRRIS